MGDQKLRKPRKKTNVRVKEREKKERDPSPGEKGSKCKRARKREMMDKPHRVQGSLRECVLGPKGELSQKDYKK